MIYKTERVALSCIDAKDFTFRLTTRSDIELLGVSLETGGMISPLLVREKENSQFCIVSGFRRFAACSKLGWQHAEARILPKNTPILACVRYAVADNAFQRELNSIEISRCLKLLQTHFPDPNHLAEAATHLGLPGNPAVIRKFLPLCDLSPVIQEGILNQSLSPAVALELAELDAETGNRLASLFSDLRLSLNKQREILQLLTEIAARDDVRVMDVLEKKDLQQIMTDTDADRGMKARNIRYHLKKKRFPAITAAEEKFGECLKQMRTGENIRLIPPRDFEGTAYTFQICFRTVEELRERMADLKRISGQKIFHQLFE